MSVTGRLAAGAAALACLAGCQPAMSQPCQEEVAKLNATILQQQQFMENMRQQVLDAERRTRDAAIERDQAGANYAAAREAVAQAVSQQPPPAYQPQQLPARVRAQLEALARQFEAEFRNNRLLLRNDLFFGPGEHTPNSNAKKVLQQVAHALRGEGLVLLIVGHTDSDPVRNPALVNRGIRDNRMLSMVRAKGVMDELAAAGYPAGQMYATGWGDMQPMVAGADAQSKARNRRVEIIVDTQASSLFGISDLRGISVTPELAAY
jgi:type VI secretion system protein ImpK